MIMENKENLMERAKAFIALHEKDGIFVIPNPWDAGSAMIMETMGFKALATTSAGLAYGLGVPDGHASVNRSAALENAMLIQRATTLPVSADLENGYGHSIEDVVTTVTLAMEAGLAGCSIEDATGDKTNPIYPLDVAVERIKAAVAAKRDLTQPFLLTARAENYLHGNTNLHDTVNRLTAFAAAGADVLFAPGLKTAEEIKTVVDAVHPKPVNVIMGLAGVPISITMLEHLGVKRISVGSSLIRAAYGEFFRALEEIRDKGTFTFADQSKPYSDLNDIFESFGKK
jgi:2-methylisocitrate lyase-like PEP mutase family enzyme